MNKTLFPTEPPVSEDSPSAPLAERMRPLRLEDVLGQDHLLDKGKFLREAIRADQIPSLIFWGPPGVGKTTLARIIARQTGAVFCSLSAVLGGVKDVKRIVEEAGRRLRSEGRRTILFVDEIHRFNKAQQDAFLPHVENGTLILIGATTENPSFEVIAPLLSRSRVLVLKPLEPRHLATLLERALSDTEQGLGQWKLAAEPEVLNRIVHYTSGDARMAMNALEAAAHLARAENPAAPVLTAECVQEALQKRTLLYDRAGEEHYNQISALHKSIRNSDADAGLYWLGRMLEAGEDPLYIARRLVRVASEDVGLAEPRALGLALDAMRAVEFIGMPEGKLALAQLVVYLSLAPKSNAIYRAYSAVQRDLESTWNEPVPLHLRNAPTALMKTLGSGREYRYAHDEPGGVADMNCLPDSLAGRHYYQPTGEGFEEVLKKKLDALRRRP